MGEGGSKGGGHEGGSPSTAPAKSGARDKEETVRGRRWRLTGGTNDVRDGDKEETEGKKRWHGGLRWI